MNWWIYRISPVTSRPFDPRSMDSARSKIRVAIILVLSNWSMPGPEEKHWPSCAGQDDVCKSHGSPENSHFGPIIFGETSPKLAEEKAATNFVWPGSDSGSIAVSNSIDAYPTLSLVTNLFVLFIDVGCTANQLNAPIAFPLTSTNFTWVNVLSVSYLYLQIQQFNILPSLSIKHGRTTTLTVLAPPPDYSNMM